MKLVKIYFSVVDVRALLERRAPALYFTTDEHGEPIRVEVFISEHQAPQGRAQALGRPPREA